MFQRKDSPFDTRTLLNILNVCVGLNASQEMWYFLCVCTRLFPDLPHLLSNFPDSTIPRKLNEHVTFRCAVLIVLSYCASMTKQNLGLLKLPI